MKQKLLVVEDDRSVCRSLQKLLETSGFAVLTASDAAQALHQFRAHAVNLVILDVNLGADSGWDVFEQMLALNPLVPTIIITAEWGQHSRAVALGAEALVEKPIDVPSFMELIESLLAETSESRLRRVHDSENRCRYVPKNHYTVSRMLLERRTAPLQLSSAVMSALPESMTRQRTGAGSAQTSVIGDTIQIMDAGVGSGSAN